MNLILTIIIAYLLGSIPTSYIFSNYLHGIDLRKLGSGNLGATNVSRIMGFVPGLIVAVLDVLKGFLAIYIARHFLSPEQSIYLLFLVGLAVIAGHNWSIFLSFAGGKGVATTLGVTLNLMPINFLIFFIVWLLIILFTKYVSLGSIIAAISLPLITIFNYNINYTFFTIIIASMIIFTHRENIKRLINGKENRMTWPPNKKG